MNTILCGLPMSGKTTIGKILATRINYLFVDTDQLIEKAYATKTGKKFSCRQIFLKEGENRFRELEKEQISSLKGTKRTVISLGGGSLVDQTNIKNLQLIGHLIYLKVSTNIIWKRMQIHGIPSYLDPVNPINDFYALSKKRIPLYEQVSPTIIETDHLHEEEIVLSILKKIHYGK